MHLVRCIGGKGIVFVGIELEGPPEVVAPLPGTTRSLPTWYWYILPHELDGYLIRMFFGLAGVDARLVKKISLVGDPGDTRFGEVIERYSPEAKYNWTETSQLYTNKFLFYPEQFPQCRGYSSSRVPYTSN